LVVSILGLASTLSKIQVRYYTLTGLPLQLDVAGRKQQKSLLPWGSQVPHGGRVIGSRHPTGFPLVHENKIGLEALGQENGSPLTRPETLAYLRQ